MVSSARRLLAGERTSKGGAELRGLDGASTRSVIMRAASCETRDASLAGVVHGPVSRLKAGGAGKRAPTRVRGVAEPALRPTEGTLLLAASARGGSELGEDHEKPAPPRASKLKGAQHQQGADVNRKSHTTATQLTFAACHVTCSGPSFLGGLGGHPPGPLQATSGPRICTWHLKGPVRKLCLRLKAVPPELSHAICLFCPFFLIPDP